MPGGKKKKKHKDRGCQRVGKRIIAGKSLEDMYCRITGCAEEEGSRRRKQTSIARQQDGVDEDHDRQICEKQVNDKRKQTSHYALMRSELKDVRPSEVHQATDGQDDQDDQRIVLPVGRSQVELFS